MRYQTILLAASLTLPAFGCDKYNAQREEKALISSGNGYAPDKRKVKEIQLLLMYEGFDPGDVDGALGPGTRDAIRDFQKSLNLSSSGYIGKKTWAGIMEIRRKGAPATVMDVQFALRKAGFDPGAIDGELGFGTRATIAQFQAAQGLKVTRTINPETWTELRKASSVRILPSESKPLTQGPH